MNNTHIKVWDPLVRFFHWGLVLAFIITQVTEDDFMGLHSWAGYFILTLLAIRIIWGFVGTRYARFSDFVYSRQTIIQFLKDTFALRARRYIGHNPAGGAMVLLLMISLLITGLTGVLVYGAAEQAGPLASWFIGGSQFWGEIFEELHEFFANFSLLLVFIHVLGVIIESFIHRENLVTAMINGRKVSSPDQDQSRGSQP